MRSECQTTEASLSFIQKARREQLIECAIAITAEEGYLAASLASVAKRAGVSKGVVLYHFQNKDALVESVVEEIFGELREAIVPRIVAEDTASGRLRALILSHLSFLELHREKLLALSNILPAHRNERGELYLLAAAERDAMGGISTFLETGQKGGEFRDFAIRPMAATILSAMNGALGQWVSDPSLSLKHYAVELVNLFELATQRSDAPTPANPAEKS